MNVDVFFFIQIPGNACKTCIGCFRSSFKCFGQILSTENICFANILSFIIMIITCKMAKFLVLSKNYSSYKEFSKPGKLIGNPLKFETFYFCRWIRTLTLKLQFNIQDSWTGLDMPLSAIDTFLADILNCFYFIVACSKWLNLNIVEIFSFFPLRGIFELWDSIFVHFSNSWQLYCMQSVCLIWSLPLH